MPINTIQATPNPSLDIFLPETTPHPEDFEEEIEIPEKNKRWLYCIYHDLHPLVDENCQVCIFSDYNKAKDKMKYIIKHVPAWKKHLRFEKTKIVPSDYKKGKTKNRDYKKGFRPPQLLNIN